MFNKLSDGFRNAKLKLQGKTTLTEDNIKYALKDVRMSLIEADVEIEVMKTFLNTVKERCLGDVVTLKTQGKQGKMHAFRYITRPVDFFTDSFFWNRQF